MQVYNNQIIGTHFFKIKTTDPINFFLPKPEEGLCTI